jgi:hypothetical protein
MFVLKLPWDRDFTDRDLCPTCSADLLGWLARAPAEGEPAKE